MFLSSGVPNPMHIPGGPPQFSSMEEMGVSSNRAKRYSSQRQRAVPEPAPPMHLGVMEGHYYETSKMMMRLGLFYTQLHKMRVKNSFSCHCLGSTCSQGFEI